MTGGLAAAAEPGTAAAAAQRLPGKSRDSLSVRFKFTERLLAAWLAAAGLVSRRAVRRPGPLPAAGGGDAHSCRGTRRAGVAANR